MAITIRPEDIADYAQIADLHLAAFGHTGVPTLVALSRSEHGFTPALSLVAVTEAAPETVVGHVLLIPHTIRLLDSDVTALVLSPLAVAPTVQKQGVGVRLMEVAHAAATEQGYALIFLLGHPEYYPRFGYQTGAYGASTLVIPPEHLPSAAAEPLLRGKPQAGDETALVDLWRHEEAGVDFSILPHQRLSTWLSPDPRVTADVFTTRAGHIVGYTRVRQTAPDAPTVFLAADHEVARQMAVQLAADLSPGTSLTLPLHPYSASAGAFAPLQAQAAAWQAGMALSLRPNPFDEVMRRVNAGERLPGRAIWPTIYDLA